MGNITICCKESTANQESSVGVPQNEVENLIDYDKQLHSNRDGDNKRNTENFSLFSKPNIHCEELLEGNSSNLQLNSRIENGIQPDLNGLPFNLENSCASKKKSLSMISKKSLLSNKSKISNKDEFECNIFLLGMSEVGKSSLIIRYTESKFDKYHIPTIKLEVFPTEILHEGKKINLFLVDTTGISEYQTELYDLYSHCDVVIYVFKLGHIESFNYVKKLMENNKNMNLNSILVGNMCDLNQIRKFNTSKSETDNKSSKTCNSKNDKSSERSTKPWLEFSKLSGIQYIETSAKNNTNVQKLFKTAINMHVKTHKPRSKMSSEHI